MGQQIPQEHMPEMPAEEGAHNMVLNHPPLTSETEEPITGIVDGLDVGQFYVQIQSESGTFSGPKTKINGGKFYYPVNLEPNRQNRFWIYVFDQNGDTVRTSIDSFTITHGLSVSGAPIPHSINVVAATRDHSGQGLTDKCDTIFERGSTLPLKNTLDGYKTSKNLKKGENSTLDITIVEGESEIPDRNTFVCQLGINGKDMPHDLPQGTPVDLTVEYSESREIIVTAYVPLIDMTLNARKTQKDEEINADTIMSDFEIQRGRINDNAEHCSEQEHQRLEGMASMIGQGIGNLDADEDEKRKSHKQLKDLKMMLDEIEGEKAMAMLISKHNDKMKNLRKTIDRHAGTEQRDEIESRFDGIKSEGQQAIEAEDKVLLASVSGQIDELESHVLYSDFGFCMKQFRYLEGLGKSGGLANESEARYYIKKGHVAIKEEDLDSLQDSITGLQRLMPSNKGADSYAGITR